MSTRVHAPHADPGLAALDGTLCGRFGDTGPAVTCRDCLRRLADVQAITPEERLLGAILGVEYTPRIGARHLEAVSRRALATAHRADDAPIRRVRSADGEAAAYFRALVEGAALRSTTDPDRANRVQTSSDPSLGGREHDAIERHATTARAIMRASWREDVLEAICSAVAPAQTPFVYALVVVGKPIRKGGWVDWRSRSPDQIASEDLAGRASTAQVLDVAGYYRDAVREALYASGELGQRRERAPARRGSFAAGPVRA